MNRSHTTQAIVWLTQIAEQALEEASKLRTQLVADARAEYAEQGTAPTWRIPDVATVSASVSKPATVVSDEEAFTVWVQNRYPDAVQTMIRVLPGWQDRFLASVEREGGVPADPETGEIIPGLKVRDGGNLYAVSIKASANAKYIFGLAATEGLKHAAALAGPNVPVVLAELEAAP